MSVSDQELKILVSVTGIFENNGDPYRGVSGDFDGQGISCGVLQWNIGQGSLQPLVKATGQQVVLSAMPTYGADMWTACNAPLKQGLAIVRSWQNGASFKAGVKGELMALMGAPAMVQQQNATIRNVATKAETMAASWVADRGTGQRTLQELVWFFDIVTQNSSLKGLSFKDVAAFKKSVGQDHADDLVCDWLAATTSKYAGMADCHKNAVTWRNAAADTALDLLVLSYLRSQQSILQWRGDVLNRKGTLAMKKGRVHKKDFDFSKTF